MKQLERKVLHGCETVRATRRSPVSPGLPIHTRGAAAEPLLWSPSLHSLGLRALFSLAVQFDSRWCFKCLGLFSVKSRRAAPSAAHSLLSSSSSGRFRPGMNLRRRLRKLFCLGFLCRELNPACFSPEAADDDPLM